MSEQPPQQYLLQYLLQLYLLRQYLLRQYLLDIEFEEVSEQPLQSRD